jgi:hypothetical protein
MAAGTIQLPADGAGKHLATETWDQAGTTVHGQKLLIADASGNVVGVTGGRLQVDGSGVTQPVSAQALPLPSGAAQEHATAASPHSARLSDGTAYIGTTAGRLHVDDGGSSLTVDGTVGVNNFPATQPVSAAALPLPAGAATEATIAGVKTGTDRIPAQVANRLPVGRPIDTGRTNVTLGFDGVVGVASEALATISGVRGNTAVGGATTQTVTAGKTLRVMAIRAVVMAGGTAVVNARVRLRANYTGAAVVGSPVYAELRPGIMTATAVANEVSPDEVLTFPDGLEFPAGTSIAITHVMTGTVTATQVSCQIVGFEY